MLTLTTYGMWEKQRQQLVEDILSDTHIDVEQSRLENCLKTTVARKMLLAVYALYGKYAKEKPNLSEREKTLQGYREMFATILPTLSAELNIEAQLLEPYVNTFVSDAMNFSQTNIEAIEVLGNASRAAKAQALSDLYGDDFADKYKNLSKLLPFCDAEFSVRAKNAVEKVINENCPKELSDVIVSHMQFINEVVATFEPNQDYAGQFEEETGCTVTEYKAKVRAERRSHSSLTGINIANDRGPSFAEIRRAKSSQAPATTATIRNEM